MIVRSCLGRQRAASFLPSEQIIEYKIGAQSLSSNQQPSLRIIACNVKVLFQWMELKKRNYNLLFEIIGTVIESEDPRQVSTVLRFKFRDDTGAGCIDCYYYPDDDVASVPKIKHGVSYRVLGSIQLDGKRFICYSLREATDSECKFFNVSIAACTQIGRKILSGCVGNNTGVKKDASIQQSQRA